MKQDATIYWKMFTEKVTYSALIDKLDEVQKAGKEVPADKSKSKWSDWSESDLNYRFVRQGDYYTLFTTYRDPDGYYIPAAYTASRYGDKEVGNTPGWKAGATMRQCFKDFNGGVSLSVAYGTVPSDVFRRFTPRTPYFLYDGLKGKLDGVTSGDYSSQYPFSACGLLPDAHHVSRQPGRVLPSKEYPFAFYMKSGHVAEYNRFDTHEWMNLPPYLFKTFTFDKEKRSCYNDIKDEEEDTLLMKASPYEMTKVMEYFYDLKKTGDPEAKAVMNMAIGTLHKKPDNRYRCEVINDYYHLAAVIIARANQRIIDKCLELGRSGCAVVMIVVDSITWIGSGTFTDPEKKLGAFCEEYHDATLYSSGKINNYTVKNRAGMIIKECAAGNHKE